MKDDDDDVDRRAPMQGRHGYAHEVSIPETMKEVQGAMQHKQMLFIELCAGSAVLSSFAKRRGYRVMPTWRLQQCL